MSSSTELNKSAEILISEINTLLEEIKQQNGGEGSLISELNNLLSETQGTEVNLTKQQAVELANQQGGKKRKKKRKSKSKKSKSKKSKSKKSKSKKSKSKKSKSKKSKSKKSKSKKSKSKKSKSKSKSKRKMRRITESEQSGGDEKKKRAPNKTFMDMIALKKWLREDKLKSENLSYILMGKPVSILYNDNKKSVEKAKKNFDKTKFMKDYNEAVKNKKTKSKKN